MKTLWQNIRGVRMLALSAMVVTLMTLAAFSITGYISGNNTFAAAAVVAASAFVVAFAASAASAASAAAVVAVVAVVAVSAVAVSAAASAFVVVFAAFVVVATDKEYKVKIRFCFYIFAAEGFLMVSAMTIWSAYLPLIIAALAIGILLLLAEAKLRLWRSGTFPSV